MMWIRWKASNVELIFSRTGHIARILTLVGLVGTKKLDSVQPTCIGWQCRGHIQPKMSGMALWPSLTT